MRHTKTFKRIILLGFVLALGANSLIAGFGGTAKVQALDDAHQQLSLYFPQDDNSVGELKKEANGGGVGDSALNGVLGKTYLFSKGGPLGNFKMGLDNDYSDSEDNPIYSTPYYCQPNSGYKMTVAKPADNVTYVKFTLAVSILHSNNWGAITTANPYNTFIGLRAHTSDDNEALVHYQKMVDTKNGNTDSYEAGASGHNESNSVFESINASDFYDNGTYGDDNAVKDLDLHKYVNSLPNSSAGYSTLFNKCEIGPYGSANDSHKVTNYYKLSPAQQAAWKKAFNNDLSSPDGGGSSASTTDNSDSLNIHCNAGFNPLSWFLCPLANSLIGLAHTFDNFISTNLCIPTDTSASPTECGGQNQDSGFGANGIASYKGGWSSMRAIALGLIVIIGLIAIISQATGMAIFDAYTVKKIMPRLLFAAIAISVSWPVINWFIGLTNDLGYGVRGIIYRAAAGSLGSGDTQTFAPDFTSGFFGTAALVYGIPGILSFAATAALFAAVAFLMLAIRQIAVIGLVIVAPIALMLYAAPFGQKLFTRWWQEFSKLTLAFPLIAGAIAIAHVFGAIGLKSDNAAGQMLGFVGYLAGDLAVPIILLKSGQLLSAAGGIVQRNAQKGYGALGKRGSERRKKVYGGIAHKVKDGDLANIVPTRFKRTNALAQRGVNAINYTGLHASSGFRGGYGFGASGRAAKGQTLLRGIDTALKEPAMQGTAASSNAFNRLMVLTAKHHGNQALAEKELREHYSSANNEYNREFTGKDLDDKVSEAKGHMRAVGGYNAGRAAAAAINMGRDGTAIRDVQDMGRVAAWVSEGDGSVGYQLLSQMSSDSGNKSRFDLAVSQDHKAALIGATIHEWQGYEGESGAKAAAQYQDIVDGATMAGAGSTDAYSLLSRASSRVVRGNVEKEMEIIQRHMADPNAVSFPEAAKAAAKIQTLKQNVDNGIGTDDNKSTFRESMAQDDRMAVFENFVRTAATDSNGNVLTEQALRPERDNRGNIVPDAQGEPILRYGPVERTGGDVADNLAGGYKAPSQEERAAAAARGEQPQPEPDQTNPTKS